LAKKPKFITAISQMTLNVAPVYSGCEHYRGEATFSPTYSPCYFNGITLVKIKGGGINDSHYFCEASGKSYRVMKFEKL